MQIIKNPMDLGTVKRKVQDGDYAAINEFRSDVNLVFDTAMKYNKIKVWQGSLLLAATAAAAIVSVSTVKIIHASNSSQYHA